MKRLIYIFILTIGVLSCRKSDSYVLSLNREAPKVYSIEYNNDIIMIQGKSGLKDTLSYSNGEYYDDKGVVLLSTCRDTSFIHEYTGVNYLRQIKHLSKDAYATSVYLLRPGVKRLLIRYEYNSEYEIKKIIRYELLEYRSESDKNKQAVYRRTMSK